MANGVVCPHCKSELEGQVKHDDIVDCPECNRKFNVTFTDLQNYKKLQAQINPYVEGKGVSKLFKVCMMIFGFIFLLGIVMSIANRDPNDHSTSAERQARYEKYVANKSEVPNPLPNDNNTTIPTQNVEARLQQSANKVAEKYIGQYEIAKGNGDKTRKCVLAGMVATAYLNANDAENYRLWHYYEKEDCK